MHKHFGRVLLLFQTIPVLISLAHAQSTILDLPRPSQHAVVRQRIGITDITLNYHRPLVNGRKIWGGLVPYGQVWRAGANENTTTSADFLNTHGGDTMMRRRIWSTTNSIWTMPSNTRKHPSRMKSDLITCSPNQGFLTGWERRMKPQPRGTRP